MTDDQSPVTRIALGVEYNGSAFKGWQAQLNPAQATVQETLEAALSRIADHAVRVHCAGRTDAGVHAAGQVVHFDTSSERLPKAWVQGVNSLLPPQVAVRWAQAVGDDFHARFSAMSRRYRYTLCNTPVRPAQFAELVTWHRNALDARAMHAAGQHLLGEQDFSAYRAQACQSRTPMRCVTELTVRRISDFIVMDIEANAFLLHMVRNIMGVLLVIGEGAAPPEWARTVLEGRDRTLAAETAPASGLSLQHVRYPAHFGLPQALSPAQLWPVFIGP